MFRVGRCTSCARTPAFPISCGHPLCGRCMPGRLAADWLRNRASLPPRLSVLLLRPRDIGAGQPGALKKVRTRFGDWRKRVGLSAGIYGCRLDAESGAVIMLAVPSDIAVPTSSRAFDVEIVAMDQAPDEVLSWLQREYVRETQSWSTANELTYVMDETKGRRRFQGFGSVYGERSENESEEQGAMTSDEAKAGKPQQALGRISGGSGKGKREDRGHSCSFCGGTVELLPFTVPPAEVVKVGNGWLWNGPTAGPPEGRRYARCDARGGVGSLRRRLGSHTPSYRQWTEALDVLQDVSAEDHLSGDNSGCLDLDAMAEELATGLEELGDDERESAIRSRLPDHIPRRQVHVMCAHAGIPISCGHPLCARCMPGRLAADWSRHRASIPGKLNLLLAATARNRCWLLRRVEDDTRSVRQWRKRAGVTAGIYGGRLDARCGAAIMLALPHDVPIPDSSRAFDVEVITHDRTPFEFLGWLQSQYVDETLSWTTTDELAFLIGETKGRRRFQGFGAIYGEQTQNESEEQETMANDEAKDEKQRRPLGRIGGGAGKGKRDSDGHACAFCGGVVELFPFTVPAAEVSRVGNGWLWNGRSAGPPEGRRYAR